MIENRMTLEIGERQTGKTTRLLFESAKTGSHILTRDKDSARRLYNMAKNMDLDLPDIVVYDIPTRRMFFYSESREIREIRKENKDVHLLIDEADCLFYYLFNYVFGEKKIDRLVCCTEFFNEIQTSLKPLTPYKLDYLMGKTEKKPLKTFVELRIPHMSIMTDNESVEILIPSMIGIDEEDVGKYQSKISILIKGAHSYIYGKLYPEVELKELCDDLTDGTNVSVIIYDQDKNPVDVLTVKYSNFTISGTSLNKKVDTFNIEGQIQAWPKE